MSKMQAKDLMTTEGSETVLDSTRIHAALKAMGEAGDADAAAFATLLEDQYKELDRASRAYQAAAEFAEVLDEIAFDALVPPADQHDTPTDLKTLLQSARDVIAYKKRMEAKDEQKTA